MAAGDLSKRYVVILVEMTPTVELTVSYERGQEVDARGAASFPFEIGQVRCGPILSNHHLPLSLASPMSTAAELTKLKTPELKVLTSITSSSPSDRSSLADLASSCMHPSLPFPSLISRPQARCKEVLHSPSCAQYYTYSTKRTSGADPPFAPLTNSAQPLGLFQVEQSRFDRQDPRSARYIQ
jgi:hypothetical protein